MENPATWTRATNVIFSAILEWGRDKDTVGFSQAALVADRLKRAGLLNEAAFEVTGYTGERNSADRSPAF
jgi:hypothetical protein